MFSRQQMAWPFATPPDLPQDRVAALRGAFEATMKDPDYLAEAVQRKLEVNPMGGAAVNQLIDELYASRPTWLRRRRQRSRRGRSNSHRVNGQNSAISGTPTITTKIDNGSPSRQ